MSSSLRDESLRYRKSARKINIDAMIRKWAPCVHPSLLPTLANTLLLSRIQSRRSGLSVPVHHLHQILLTGFACMNPVSSEPLTRTAPSLVLVPSSPAAALALPDIYSIPMKELGHRDVQAAAAARDAKRTHQMHHPGPRGAWWCVQGQPGRKVWGGGARKPGSRAAPCTRARGQGAGHVPWSGLKA